MLFGCSWQPCEVWRTDIIYPSTYFIFLRNKRTKPGVVVLAYKPSTGKIKER